jgi:hypothetical protein
VYSNNLDLITILLEKIIAFGLKFNINTFKADYYRLISGLKLIRKILLTHSNIL